ncbi:MAG: acylphosphatase [Thermoplasmata archaeon]
MEVRAHVLFFGQVQGVYFRDNTRRKAEDLGVRGWVRNLRDGSVEAVMEGPQEQVEALIEWCRTSQPYARVAEIKVSWGALEGGADRFSVRR